MRGRGCPACTRVRRSAEIREQRSRIPAARSIAFRRPAIAAELHPSRNGDLDPSTLAAYSNRVLWWLCPACGGEWQAAPNARGKAGHCPECRG
jgi:hypothetical protein